MKIKDGFILRQISDTYVIVAVGDAAEKFNGMIAINDSGAFIWSRISEGLSKEEIVKALLQEYDVDEETAKHDVDFFIASIIDAGFTEEE